MEEKRGLPAAILGVATTTRNRHARRPPCLLRRTGLACPRLVLPAFNPPTFVQLLAVAAILTTGRRTVSPTCCARSDTLAPGRSPSYHRVLSQAHWSGLRLAAAADPLPLASLLARWPCHACRRRHRHRAPRTQGLRQGASPRRRAFQPLLYGLGWGHKWVVLAILVRFPFTQRPWALPVLVALYRSREDNDERGRPHKTPAQVMQVLLRLLLRWFPDRSFRFAGDAGYGSHEMATFAQQTQGRLHLVSKFHPDANLSRTTTASNGQEGGASTQEGRKATQQEVVAGASRTWPTT